ncbi:MAG: glycosyltransferase family 39 protein [Fermentimonas sp.]|nr:glycosyltransferase family 39 protein [Fermentimonas sp.]
MIALIIKAGTLIAGDSLLGVRLIVMIMQVVFLCVLYKLLEIEDTKENVILFFLVSFSVVMLQAYGFVATPDSALLFFSVLFLWSYRFYINRDYSVKGALLMSLSMAGLMYSKYHGALVIILVICSNLKLFRKPTFYYSVIIALILYIPHILWQVNHEFPSLKYHLVDRSRGFEWSNILDYLLNQLPVFNPFTLVAGIYVLFINKKGDLFQRALKFLMAGFLIFFALWTFKSRVEPHWTIAASVPMVILILREAVENKKLKRYLYKVVAPSLILVLAARVFLMVDVLPIKTEWHGDKQRVSDLHAVAGDRPVVFTSGFQMPSKYRFYTGREAHAMGALNYRNTQYDIWRFDEKYLGKPVVLDFRNDTTGVEPTISRESIFNLKEVEQYQPFKRLKVIPHINDNPLSTGNKNELSVTIFNPYDNTYNINHPSMPLQISLVFLAEIDGKIVREKVPAVSTFETDEILSGESVSCNISFDLSEYPSGEYDVYFAAGTTGVYPATLEKPRKVVFE